MSLPARQLRARAGEDLIVERLGRVPYREAWALQRALVERHHRDRSTPDTVLLVEHPDVYTLGRRADRANVLLDELRLAQRGIEVVEVDRGGDVTWHGPGQLVVYPILRLAGTRAVVEHVRALEAVVLDVLERLGIAGDRVPGRSGVWVEGEKIAAVGVRVDAGGVTSHGLALNVDPDPAGFAGIVPCGIADAGVTSLARLGLAVGLEEVEVLMVDALGRVLEGRARTMTPAGPLALVPARRSAGAAP
ncbi:MAG: hypothetical protein RLZZ272_1355 [Actinomycetota bacterium]|jgi:lipoyl(octanoyl) transferase